MITSWPQAAAAKRSPLNIGRSPERNRRKQDRSEENRKYRASLHSSKANGRSMEEKNTIQNQIGEISKRG